jgi:ABC-type multidrug transport system fused ATPase/permease subunit
VANNWYFFKKIQSSAGKLLYLNLAAMVFISLFEGVAIFLLFPLIGLTGAVNIEIGNNTIIWGINNFFQSIPKDISLIIVLLIYALLMISHSFFQRSQVILNGRIQQRFISRLRIELYKSLILANWELFIKKRKTDIVNSMTSELSRVAGGTHLFLHFIASIIYTIIQIAVAFWLSIKLTIFILFCGIVLILLSRIFVKRSEHMGSKTVELSKTYLAGITDHFNGIKDIKGNMLEESHLKWIRSFTEKSEKTVIELIKIRATSQLVFKIASVVLTVFLIYVSIKMFHSESAQLMLIIILFARIWPRLNSIQSNLEQISTYSPSFRNIIELQNESIISEEINEEMYKHIPSLKIETGLECNDLYFRYDKNSLNYDLASINLKIPVNQMTAIAGPSGAGKSTLIDIVMGLIQPENGDIFIDGFPLSKDNLLSLRRSISYVPQDPFLFNASIRENLLLSCPRATEVEMWEALDFSSANFVKTLPKGLDTIIGDRGIRLSGGERQRIVLARAILRKPEILILDEATSALDTENERKIQESLETLKGKMTIIVIAHRLSTIRNADQVVVLDQGKIIQTGKFNELAKDRKGLFSNLLGKQLEATL